MKVHYPHAAVAYPTALKLARAGKIRTTRVGDVLRIYRDEIERFAREGNYEETGSDLPRSLTDVIRKLNPPSLTRKIRHD